MFSKSKSDQERLHDWRVFRQLFDREIGTEQTVVDAFKSVPTQRRFLDYYTPDSWPSVFEIVQQGMFCQTGITLVMASTLVYLDFIKTKEIHLEVISNHITGSEGLVLAYNGMYYNFVPGTIVSEEYVLDNSTKFDSHIIAADKLCS